MTMDLRVLQIVRELPLPARTGGHKRVLGMAGVWGSIGTVDVAGPPSRFGEPDISGPYRRIIPLAGGKLGRAAALALSITSGSPRVMAASRRTPSGRQLSSLRAERYDLVVIEELLAAPIHQRIEELFDAKVVYSAHNVESAIAYPYRNGHWTTTALQRLDRIALARLERRLAAAAVGIVCCTEDDAVAFRPADRPAVVVPNCADPMAPPPPWAERRGLLLFGSFGWLPNLEGLRWFEAEVLPRARSIADLSVRVVTSALPRRDRITLSALGVDLRLAVPNIVPLAHDARVAAVPVFTAGGSRVRIVEALEFGLHVVTTTVGVRGQPVSVRAACEIADDPMAFAEAIVRASDRPGPPAVPDLPRWGSFDYVVRDLCKQVGFS